MVTLPTKRKYVRKKRLNLGKEVQKQIDQQLASMSIDDVGARHGFKARARRFLGLAAGKNRCQPAARMTLLLCGWRPAGRPAGPQTHTHTHTPPI